MKKLPYAGPVEYLAELQDLQKFQSPFEMLNCVFNISKLIEQSINEFWDGVTVSNPDKLIIDGDNILMLYLYIVIRAKIPAMPAYMKLMDEFSTPFVKSTSRFGYCISTLEIAMERIFQFPLSEVIQLQRDHSEVERSKSFTRDIKDLITSVRDRTESLIVEEGTMNPKVDSLIMKHRKANRESSFKKTRTTY